MTPVSKAADQARICVRLAWAMVERVEVKVVQGFTVKSSPTFGCFPLSGVQLSFCTVRGR